MEITIGMGAKLGFGLALGSALFALAAFAVVAVVLIIHALIS